MYIKNNKSKSIVFWSVIALATALFSGIASAQPNGQPFGDVQAQLDELTTQVSALQAANRPVTSLEDLEGRTYCTRTRASILWQWPPSTDGRSKGGHIYDRVLKAEVSFGVPGTATREVLLVDSTEWTVYLNAEGLVTDTANFSSAGPRPARDLAPVFVDGLLYFSEDDVPLEGEHSMAGWQFSSDGNVMIMAEHIYGETEGRNPADGLHTRGVTTTATGVRCD